MRDDDFECHYSWLDLVVNVAAWVAVLTAIAIVIEGLR